MASFPRLLAFGFVLLLGARLGAGPNPPGGYETQKLEALRLAATSPDEAEPRLRALLGQRADDADVLLRLARIVFERGRAENPAGTEQRPATFREARALFARAQAAGSTEPLVATALASIRPDGTLVAGQFSTDLRVNAALQEGEQAFLGHDFDHAIAAYERVLALEPKNYLATLYTGDAHFSTGRIEEALGWFQRAAEIEPDTETAHRYQGDALVRLGRTTDALDHYLEAVIAEPGSPFARRALANYCQAVMLRPWIAGEDVGRGTVAPGAKGKPDIRLLGDANATDIYYTAARAQWQAEHPLPPGQSYRLTLAEEVDALRTVLRKWSELKQTSTADAKVIEPLRSVEPSLEQLQEIDAAGLLETHILLFRGGADLAPDYADFRRAHRPLLRTYLRKFYLHLP